MILKSYHLLIPPQRKIIVVYCTSNHILAIESRRCTVIPVSRDTRLCHFCSYDAIVNGALYVLECPLYNPTRDKFTSLFENEVLESLKSFFNHAHKLMSISIYLTKATALHQIEDLTGLKSSWRTFNLVSLLSFPDFKIYSISLDRHIVKYCLWEYSIAYKYIRSYKLKSTIVQESKLVECGVPCNIV